MPISFNFYLINRSINSININLANLWKSNMLWTYVNSFSNMLIHFGYWFLNRRLWNFDVGTVRLPLKGWKPFFPADIYRSKTTMETPEQCEICSRLTIKIPEQYKWRCSGVFIVNLEEIPHILVFSFLTLNKLNARWVSSLQILTPCSVKQKFPYATTLYNTFLLLNLGFI